MGIHVAVLTDGVISELTTQGRAERTRKIKKQISKARASFVTDPFRFTIRCSRNEVEHHLRETHHQDPQQNVDIGPCPRNVEVEPPALDSKEPSWKEVTVIVKRPDQDQPQDPTG